MKTDNYEIIKLTEQRQAFFRTTSFKDRRVDFSLKDLQRRVSILVYHHNIVSMETQIKTNINKMEFYNIFIIVLVEIE